MEGRSEQSYSVVPGFFTIQIQRQRINRIGDGVVYSKATKKKKKRKEKYLSVHPTDQQISENLTMENKGIQKSVTTCMHVKILPIFSFKLDL